VLTELAITDLGVIAELSLVLEAGLTAVTGETGAGKTMVVEAIGLLLGGRADGTVVRTGCAEAVVEGRFVLSSDDEVVVRRVVPRDGRSRAYVDGRLATVSTLAELGVSLVDIHGQHAHQSLATTATQRAALDRFGGVDTAELDASRAELSAIDHALASLGGDERARARELDLYRFQVDELRRAAIDDPAEDERLERDESELSDALAHREAGAAAGAALAGDDGSAGDVIAGALASLGDRAPYRELAARLRSVQADLDDIAHDIRAIAERIEEDPERLAALRARRQLLRDLRRKYGPTLDDVIAYAVEAEERLSDLVSHDERAAELDARRVAALRARSAAEARVRAARVEAGPRLAKAVERHLRELAMPKAKLDVQIDGAAGEDVRVLLAANPGTPALPLAKVASGGELARAMLALRLALPAAGDTTPPTYVFDEVDAGIGGAAATAVGRALAKLARRRQVLVVTHLPQVAAYADHHVAVHKSAQTRSTSVRADVVVGATRVVELSRMLSGSPESATAREHAAELLRTAAAER
jgi:DNA repair protein RecN (Recombination protein N)